MASRITKPGGSKPEKPWRDALMVAVNERGAGGAKNLRRIAEQCVEAALNGDMHAIKEIGDRLDGKAPQGFDLTPTDGGGVITVQWRRPADSD
jgi:hypothetical protein